MVIACSVFTTDAHAALLDEYPGAYLAVAPFTLSSAYIGPLMRVERSSDGVQGDIMPDGNGYISLTSTVTNRSDVGANTTLADFAGTDTIYSMVFYDQSGFGNDLSTTRADKARVLMDAGELKKDSRGNPGTWYELEETYSERGYTIKQLHTSFSIGHFTAITLAEPYYMMSGTHPDSGFFNFGPYVGALSQNKHFLLRVDGNYKRASYLVGNGLDENGGADGDAVYLVDEPAVYVVAANGTTLESQTNTIQYATAVNPYTPPSTDWVQPFACNDGIKCPLRNIASGFILYPEYKDRTERDAIVNTLRSSYDMREVVGVHASAILPQEKQDYVTLYDWLETLNESDFDIPQEASTEMNYTPTGATVRDLYGTYYGLQDRAPRNDFLRYPSSAFVLDNGSGEGIEGDSANVRVLKSSGGDEGVNLEAAFFYTFTKPGISNPYYQHQGLANRLVSQAMAMMMEIDHQLHYGNAGAYPEYTGMDVMQMMTAFEAGKYDAKGITNSEREVFYRTVNSIMNYWDLGFGGPKDANTNMDTKTFYGLALLYQGATEQGMTDIATNARELAAKYLLGSRDATNAGDANGEVDHVIFHSAGYVGERSLPETSYNGISLYYLAKAAAVVDGVSGWEWLWDEDGVVDRMAKFKSYQIFRDPDGFFNGPSGYAVRTNDPYAEDQSSSRGRDFIVAQLSDYGKEHFWKRRGPSIDLTYLENPTLETVETTIQDELNGTYGHYGEGAFTPIDPVYKIIDSGDERWWAARVSTIANDYYDPSFFDTITSMIDASGPGLELPVLRDNFTYNEAFGRDGQPPEFWSLKGSDENANSYAAFLESFTRKPESTNGYSSWRGGGTIQTFWTEEAGVVINTRASKHEHSATQWPAVSTWATHHLWGTLSDDSSFSSAQRDSRITDYTYDDITDPTQFTATNNPDRESGDYTGTVTYERTIKKVTNGLEVTTTLTTDEQDTIKTLWESLPVYISYNKTTNAITSIEYTTDSLSGTPTWTLLAETPIDNVTAIRLTRDHGNGPAHVYIVPNEPQTMKLAPEWQADYQQSDYFQQLMIDLHPNSGIAQSIPESSVTYAVSTVLAASGATTLWADFNQDNTVNIFDYNLLITNFGATSDCDNPADANGDCSVNIFDYNILLGEFGGSV